MLKTNKDKIQKKYEQLQQNVEKYEKIFHDDSTCRNLRNYNNALIALKHFEKKHEL